MIPKKKRYGIFSLDEEELLEVIANFRELKPILQHLVFVQNGRDIKQGKKDAVELGRNFDVAIEAMTMMIAILQGA